MNFFVPTKVSKPNLVSMLVTHESGYVYEGDTSNNGLHVQK